jgi:hypothetical protein
MPGHPRRIRAILRSPRETPPGGSTSSGRGSHRTGAGTAARVARLVPGSAACSRSSREYRGSHPRRAAELALRSSRPDTESRWRGMSRTPLESARSSRRSFHTGRCSQRRGPGRSHRSHRCSNGDLDARSSHCQALRSRARKPPLSRPLRPRTFARRRRLQAPTLRWRNTPRGQGPPSHCRRPTHAASAQSSMSHGRVTAEARLTGGAVGNGGSNRGQIGAAFQPTRSSERMIQCPHGTIGIGAIGASFARAVRPLRRSRRGLGAARGHRSAPIVGSTLGGGGFHRSGLETTTTYSRMWANYLRAQSGLAPGHPSFRARRATRRRRSERRRG